MNRRHYIRKEPLKCDVSCNILNTRKSVSSGFPGAAEFFFFIDFEMFGYLILFREIE